MALWSTVKALLNSFADTQPALRLATKPLAESNPNLGDAIDARIASESAAAQAAAEAYAAGTPADWAGAAPTTVAEALDRLAAATPGA